MPIKRTTIRRTSDPLKMKKSIIILILSACARCMAGENSYNGYSSAEAAQHSAEMAKEMERLQILVDADQKAARDYYKAWRSEIKADNEKASQENLATHKH
jgi:hypothetical protein